MKTEEELRSEVKELAFKISELMDGIQNEVALNALLILLQFIIVKTDEPIDRKLIISRIKEIEGLMETNP